MEVNDSRPLHPEDIINIDLTLYHDSYHGDTSATFVLPDTDKKGRDLVEATREALDLGMGLCRPGQRYSEVGRVIEWVNSFQDLLQDLTGDYREFAIKHGFSVNTQLSGHGIGRDFHREPWILHHSERLSSKTVGLFGCPNDCEENSDTEIMKPGDCFTIEPILVQGSKSRGKLWDDGWTVATEVSFLLLIHVARAHAVISEQRSCCSIRASDTDYGGG